MMKEQEITIDKARLEFKSYIKLSAWMGLCFGCVLLVLDMGLDLIRILAGDIDASVMDLVFNLAYPFVMPLSFICTALISYPVYRYLTNNKFSMNLKMFTLKNH